MNVAAIIVTRGDQNLVPVLASLPEGWEKIVWDNGETCRGYGGTTVFGGNDLAVYGRYAAIEHTAAELIFVQDDDVVVSDPQAIVDAWMRTEGANRGVTLYSHVVCNMPPEFRHDFYTEHALVGFGAVFHRDAPKRAFQKAADAGLFVDVEVANRTCDIVFTALTPRVLVDVSITRLPWDSDPNRMWMQPEHQAERTRMLELVKGVKV